MQTQSRRVPAVSGLGILLAFAAVTLAAVPVEAQIGTSGAFVGTVHDASGAVLPGATVTATHVGTGATQTTVSDSAGRYRLPSLPLGEYRIEGEMDGFQREVHEGLSLTVGRTLDVNFVLQVGQRTEAISVKGEAPLVETVSSSVVGRISDREVRELPLNGRSFDQLVSLSAGTVLFSARQTNAARGTGNLFATAGSRPNTTKFLVDGAELAGAGGLNTSVSSASGKMLGVEGIQEFAVVTNTGDASYGKKPGGQVSIVTRSGSNAFHGSAFEFMRDDRFDARGIFDEEKPHLSQHNYGAAIGGPILRNRSFFFANIERFRERRDVTILGVVPTLAVREGRLPNGTAVTVHPAIKPALDLYPAPNGRDFGDGTAESIQAASRAVNDTFFVTRLDHNFSTNDSLFGRYMIQKGDRLEPNDRLGQFFEENPFRTHLLTIGHKKILTSRLLNQATFAMNGSRYEIDFVPRDGLTIPDVMLIVPGQTRHGGIGVGVGSGSVTQLPTLGGEGTMGTAGRFVDRKVLQVSDQLSYTRGAHFLQTGLELQRIHSDEFSGTQARGFLEFNSLQNLVTGRPSRVRGPLPGSDAFRNWRQWYFGVYGQDSYKITDRFTLNYGLRWEFLSNPIDTGGRMSAFVPEGSSLDGVYPTVPPVVPTAFAENRSGNFAPRLGFAWDLFGNGRTALRGGLGLFYAQLENEYRRALGAAAPFFNRVTVNNPPFPDPGASLANAALGRLTPLGIHQFPDIPVTTQYNLRLERAVGAHAVASIGFVGSRGRHQPRTGNPQMPVPVENAQGRLAVAPVLVSPAHAAGASFIVFDAGSWYDSLQLELEQRLVRGLRFKAAFTWSKAIDEGVDNNSSPNGTPDSVLVMSDHTFDRALAPYHTGRRFVINWSYDLPLGTRGGIAGALLSNWQFAGIFQAQDGFPFTALTGFPRSWPVGDTAADRPDVAPGAGNPVVGGPDRYFDPNAFQLQPVGIIGNSGVATMMGPGLALMDVSLLKRLTFGKGMGVELRTEVFNLLNRPNLGIPDNVLFNTDGTRRGAAGRISSTLTTPREFQFSVKFIF